MHTPHLTYIARLADNALIHGQRLSEWCGHAPILEEDLSLANTALDHIGQARMLYTHLGQLDGSGRGEDHYAYWRDPDAFVNCVLVELPNTPPAAATATQGRDFGLTMVRQWMMGSLMVLWWEALTRSTDDTLAAIAAKSVKEARFHRQHARQWLVRLGDGTATSHARVQAAVDALWPYTRELFAPDAVEQAVTDSGVGVAPATLHAAWLADVQDALAQATLQQPPDSAFLSDGKNGHHSEHLSYLLTDLQSVARAHPEGAW
jgi:ring-1,2-phenylacetyl-CoA epoxidase subunit PaaC